MIYTSNPNSATHRLQSVKSATEEMAKQLKLDFEIVRQTQGPSPIYVYYGYGNDEPIPLYCDEGKTGDPKDISSKIKNMIFVLSFHPRHQALRQAREALLTFS
jgi:hypothetical protein